tara:strand:- start:4467 stop:5966 length:1500 start_codon:yes stop_codon:yes gene_type:complete
MRKYSLIKILSLLAFVFVGCEDAIEIDQPGRLDADAAFQTVEDLQSGLYGVYDDTDLTQEIQFSAIFTDELAIGFSNGGQGISDYGFVLNAGSDAPQAFWTRWYTAINSANRVLEAAETIMPAEGEESLYNDILGQTYALRAFAHFQLESYFTTDYTDDSALGVIALDYVPTIDQQLLRNTNGEVFALIKSDLDKAQNLISYQSNATFISKDFVLALKARMAAYRQNYTEAATYASTLLGRYPLADRTEYAAMFADQDNTEIIFKLERAKGDNYDGQGSTGSAFAGGWAGANFAFGGPDLAGSPYFEIGRSLYNALDMDDVRYDVNVSPTSVIDPNYPDADNYTADDILIVNKYRGSEGVPLMNDLKVFRSSEMLFILAEARADAGTINGANSTASLIKQIRDARFGTDTELPTYANKAEAFGAILDESRIEFAFEGHRYKDLKRLGERANRQITKDPLDCGFNGACTLSPNDYRFTLPLPIIEFNGNPGLREQQNPGY